MRNFFSNLVNALLPNSAYRRNRPVGLKERARYWALRAGVAILLVILIYLLGVQQHRALW